MASSIDVRNAAEYIAEYEQWLDRVESDVHVHWGRNYNQQSFLFSTYLINPVTGSMVGGNSLSSNDRSNGFPNIFWVRKQEFPIYPHYTQTNSSGEVDLRCAVTHSFNVMFAGNPDTDSLVFDYVDDWNEAEHDNDYAREPLVYIKPLKEGVDPVVLKKGSIIKEGQKDFINEDNYPCYFLSPASKYIPVELEKRVLDNDDVLGNMPGAIYIPSIYWTDARYEGATLVVENMYYYISTSDIGALLSSYENYTINAITDPTLVKRTRTFVSRYTNDAIIRSKNKDLSEDSANNGIGYDVLNFGNLTAQGKKCCIPVVDRSGKLPLGSTIRTSSFSVTLTSQQKYVDFNSLAVPRKDAVNFELGADKGSTAVIENDGPIEKTIIDPYTDNATKWQILLFPADTSTAEAVDQYGVYVAEASETDGYFHIRIAYVSNEFSGSQKLTFQYTIIG